MNERKNLFTTLGEWWDQREKPLKTKSAERSSNRMDGWLPTRGNIIFTLLVIGLLLWAQTVGAIALPSTVNAPDVPSTGTIAYQGRLADASGNPLTSTVPMEFRLYSVPTGGAPLWEEFWTGANSVQVSDGLFNVMLGSLLSIPTSLVASNTSLFLGITAGTDDEMAPRVQLGSVPFAVQALTVPDGSVTTIKIADGSVTQAKAPYLLGGQGMGYRVQSGKITTHALGGADVFFDPPYAEPPTVVAVAQDFNVQLYSQPTTNSVGFTINSANAGVAIHWVAVGH